MVMPIIPAPRAVMVAIELMFVNNTHLPLVGSPQHVAMWAPTHVQFNYVSSTGWPRFCAIANVSVCIG